MRSLRHCALLFLTLCSPLALADALRFDIPAQPLPEALKIFADQAKMQLLYQPEAISAGMSNAVVGDFEKRTALELLLKGTGYEVVFSKGNAATVRRVENGAASGVTVSSATAGDNVGIRLVQSAAGSRSSEAGGAEERNTSAASGYDDQSSKKAIEEIIVTAQKRVERLQDVPIPVTAISAATLLGTNQLRLQDYFTRIPGLSVTPSYTGDVPMLSIRGVTTGPYTNPAVGIVVDDIPYGSTTLLGGGELVPDIDPSELSRIEVLRGPQGTLYGAASMGGLVKFVTVDPSTERLSGRVQASLSSVQNGDELGYNVRGAINVPLGETWAMRASAFTRLDAGYVDDPGLGAEGVNRMTVNGGRLSALWRPSDAFSLKLSALFQHTIADGSSDVDGGLGDLEQRRLRTTGSSTKRVESYSASLNAKLGQVDLTSLSGYSVSDFTSRVDLGLVGFGPLTQAQFGVPGTLSRGYINTNKFTQEIRLSAPIGPKVDWLLGAFYTHESSYNNGDLFAVDPDTLQVFGNWLHGDQPFTYDEYAAFANLTFHITDRFDVQVGGRSSQNRQKYTSINEGPYVSVFGGGTSPQIVPQVKTRENAFTYLVTPRLKIMPELMVYARLASGYRPGGPNTSLGASGIAPEFDSDTTQNYEIGIKGDVLGRLLTLDASLYRINWKDIQIQLYDPVNRIYYFANGSEARSQGIEFSVESRPLEGMTIAAWVAWNDAELTEAFPATSTVYGVAGSRLPNVSRVSGNFSLDQAFNLTASMTGFAGFSVSYIGEREGDFIATPQRQILPAFARTDLHAGVKYESWTVDLFANNITNKRGLLRGGLGAYPPNAFNYILPRTVGLSVARTF